MRDLPLINAAEMRLHLVRNHRERVGLMVYLGGTVA
jgi:hypothetical protein